MNDATAERLVLLDARLALLEQAIEAVSGSQRRPNKRAGAKTPQVAAVQVPVQPPSVSKERQDNLVSIAELAVLDGEAFVSLAYRRLLRKEVDPGGLEFYLYELARGQDKASILRRLANEPEAIEAGVTVVD
jgi:hypothetical protein